MSQVGADSNSTGHGDMGTSFSEVGFGRCSHRLFIKVLRILYFPGSTRGEEPACQRRRHKTPSFGPWVGKVPWRRKRQPTPVFLPGDSHGQRSLVGNSPWGQRESDPTDQLNQHHYKTRHCLDNPAATQLLTESSFISSRKARFSPCEL